jgi:hypothetical protein
MARAGVLASANDLAPAAASVVDGLTALRRALVRQLGRPVGVSGSGPTLWVLYPSAAAADAAAADVRRGIDDGALVAPGQAPPSIIATSFAVSFAAPEPGPGEPATPTTTTTTTTSHSTEGRS